jgi:hypothetical protein
LRDLGLLEELGAIAFGGDQLVELLDLVAELDRKRVGLEFATSRTVFKIVLRGSTRVTQSFDAGRNRIQALPGSTLYSCHE